MSSNSWFNIWFWLEINLVSFISFMLNNKYSLSIESSLIYFLIQTIASIIIIFCLLLRIYFKKIIFFILLTLIIKINISPFHFWLLLLIEGINWINILILLTWQKLAPLIIIYYLNILNYILIFIILSIFIRFIIGLNYYSIKKIICFSSINQIRWLIISLKLINLIWKTYIILYFF